ncbi:hypothetical protein TWF569_003299 [Orbilia oligospora]|uniref:Maleylacetoacetate isomerase n=1 Tax=Orbilia oligospora TaxID=2813651 RepID=A0A7C8JC71_ORBOL|nr:hypothetical protein TWF102_003414 [Orbilia oligospora]KAF3104705.1 hypothetical protein TWF706_004487 [Orbilia oligospora]KAF3115400.1 hypothetical protein TWF103_010827 [Orbilia oligospora]KAF3120359.1 hypothetical protein TWF569_003299 [Orbilia oligospora]KAF3139726.1 hypothetical protein TWF594_006587 [Orbilia oligospora]
MSSQPKITLHTYFRSSCSARVRMALHLKGLTFTPVYIHLLKDDQFSESYVALNPSKAVPTITFSPNENDTESEPVAFVLTQSVAILEYLDERFPAPEYPALLPKNLEDRARVRQLSHIVACDIQPLTNLKMLKEIKKFAGEAGKNPDTAGPEWQRRNLAEGLRAFEAVVSKTAGKYCVGDTVTMADFCLIPTIDSAVRFGVGMGEFETIGRIWRALEEVEAVQKGGWRTQGDTPEEFRC